MSFLDEVLECYNPVAESQIRQHVEQVKQRTKFASKKGDKSVTVRYSVDANSENVEAAKMKAAIQYFSDEGFEVSTSFRSGIGGDVQLVSIKWNPKVEEQDIFEEDQWS